MIGLALELVLVALLLAAAGMCWRLDQRLKSLRSGQDGMARAVEDLHRATQAAHASVEALRRSRDLVARQLDEDLGDARHVLAELHRASQHVRASHLPIAVAAEDASQRPARFRTDLPASTSDRRRETIR
jgi:hypothetical protein